MIIDALNKASSQIWAAFLVTAGIATFGLACWCHAADVRAALMSSGTGMIGGGIAMFQHQSKDANPAPPEKQI